MMQDANFFKDTTMLPMLLTILRDKNSTISDFRRASELMANILARSAADNLPLKDFTVETPLGPTKGHKIDAKILLIPVLRGGLALLPAFMAAFPNSKVGFVGIKRDEETAKPVLYYQNIPDISPETYIFILDPMIATGGSGAQVIQLLRDKHADESKMHYIGVVAAPEGVERLKKAAPKMKQIITAIDEQLNDKKFIVPGLGDFGDRFFGTL